MCLTALSTGSPRWSQRQNHWLRSLRCKPTCLPPSLIYSFAYQKQIKQQDSSYDNDNLNSGRNTGSGLGRDQFSDSSNYNRGGALGSDDIASRGNTLGRDEFSGGNTSGSGLGRDEYSSGRDTYGSSNTDRDTYGSSNTGRDNFSSSNDNYGSSNTGSTGYGSNRTEEFGHHHKSAGEGIGHDDLKPRHGTERDTHHSTGGNYPVSPCMRNLSLSLSFAHHSWLEHGYFASSVLSYSSIVAFFLHHNIHIKDTSETTMLKKLIVWIS